MQSQIVRPLIEMLGSSDVRQVNGAVGVFRNLALPGARAHVRVLRRRLTARLFSGQ